MLNPQARYQVEQLVPIAEDGPVQSPAPFFDQLQAGGVELHGAWLAQVGLPMPRATAETCFIVRLLRVG